MQKLGWLTPYEMLYGKLPPYDHMKIFGCLCFVVNLKSMKDKFDNKGIPSVFFGYSRTQRL